MSAVGLLFRDTLRRDRVRLACALLGVAAAAALLAWTLGLAATTWWQGRPLSEAMGRPYDCWVATGRASAAAPKGSGMQRLAHGSPVKMIPAAVAEAVKASPDVASVVATTVFRCTLDWRPEGRPLQGPGVGGGIAPVRDFPECPYPDGLAAGRWPRADAPEPEFAITPRAFGENGLRDAPPVGTRVAVVTPSGKRMATICGYLSERIRPVGGFPTMFASDALAEAAALADTEGLCNLMLIRLKPRRSPETLRETVRTISPDDDAATLTTRADLLRQLRSDAIQNLARQVPLLVALACVATLCMIVNALCVGLEQNRPLHVRLRALGMEAGQLCALIGRECLFLAGAGGALGFLVGWGLLAAFVHAKPLVFPDGLWMGWPVPAAVATLLTLSAGVALVVPLWRIARLRPYELRAAPEAWRHPRPVARLLTSLALMVPVLLTLVLFPASPLLRSAWFLVAGLPPAIWGLLRLAKPALWLAERLLARPVGALLGLRPELLRGTLTRAAGRNARLALTLTAGLGAFFAIHIWGASLTDSFIPSRDLPDAIVSLLPNGISMEGWRDGGMEGWRDRGMEGAGLRPVTPAGGTAPCTPASPQAMPSEAPGNSGNPGTSGSPAVAGRQSRGARSVAARSRAASSPREASAEAPQSANQPISQSALRPFHAEQYPLAEEDFEAIAARTRRTPKQNNILLIGSEGETGVTITEMFARQCGLGVGDTFHIRRKGHDGSVRTLPLTVTAVRRVNWHLFTARAKLRARNGTPFGTLGPVFVGAEAFRAWDPARADRIRFLWATLPKASGDAALYSLSDRLELALQRLADRDAATRPYVASLFGAPPRRGVKPAPPPNVIVHLRDEISEGTIAHSTELLGDLARIPLWSLLILCTGFVSLLAANVRVQAGELRTLHAIGMTRAQMGRFLFAQTLLLGVAAAFLALVFGLTVGWGFTGWTLAWLPFGGLPTRLVLPLAPILQGLAVLLTATLLMTPLPILFLVRRLLRR